MHICAALILVLPGHAFAHEMWVLTDAMIQEWSSKPYPSTYTSFTVPTVLTLTIALLVNSALVQLDRAGANELFPLLRARLRAMRPYSPVVLRICLGWVLISSALSAEPRYGNAVWTNPSLLAPDILIGDLPFGWHWLLWSEIIIGLAMFAGIYVRVAAVACIFLVFVTSFLVGKAALFYAPIYMAVALYLFVVGAGSHYIALPTLKIFEKFEPQLLLDESFSRAQFLLRVLTGFNFLLLAVCFKVLQPNLMLAIIDIHKLPTFGFSPDVFVLIIAAIEVSIGLLMIFGILLRFLMAVLIIALTCFAFCLSDAENLTSHMLYYGVAIALLFNGKGQWQNLKPVDIQAKIVILGNSISAVCAAQYLERILPKPSNVQVSLLSERSDVQFKNPLPEVVSGIVQPNTLINSLTKILGRTRLVLANTRSIDTLEKTVTYSIPGGKVKKIHYDQLIIANDPVTDFDCESRTDGADIEHLESVVDALNLKKSLLRCLFCKQSSSEGQVSEPINIAIYGASERGSALAMEIHALIQTLINDGSISPDVVANVVLFESSAERVNMNSTILKLREKHFKSRNIKVIPAEIVSTLCSDSVKLYDGKSVDMDIVVNLGTRDVLPELSRIDSLPETIQNANLALCSFKNVWLASHDEWLKKNPQRRISLKLEQSRLAAMNAWASSQDLETSELTRVKKSLYEWYMGRYSIATWNGTALPGAFGWLLNRRRFLSVLPSMERKLRIIIDWSFGFFFNNDTAGFMEHDYESRGRAAPYVSVHPNPIGYQEAGKQRKAL